MGIKSKKESPYMMKSKNHKVVLLPKNHIIEELKSSQEKTIKSEVLNEFVVVLNEIDKTSSDEIESRIQRIIRKIRPLLYKP